MNKYSTAAALRHALDDRLKIDAQSTGSDHMRLRRTVVFDRIAARGSFDARYAYANETECRAVDFASEQLHAGLVEHIR